MNDTKSIKGYAVTVTLAKSALGYEVGHKFSTKLVREEGIVLVTGHGTHETIPHDCLGKYVATWKEVTKQGHITMTVEKKEDVTAQWTNYWKEQTDKRNAAQAKQQRADNKRRIAHLRQIIKMVQTGKAEEELNELLKKI
jgi:hypothetical protein